MDSSNVVCRIFTYPTGEFTPTALLAAMVQKYGREVVTEAKSDGVMQYTIFDQNRGRTVTVLTSQVVSQEEALKFYQDWRKPANHERFDDLTP